MTTPLPKRFALNLYDELLLHLDQPASPLGLQMEIRVSGHLDETRLTGAIRTAARKHPMSRVSLVPHAAGDSEYFWQLHDELEQVPLRIIQCCDEESLHEARSTLHSLPIPLAEAPPFRCALAHCGERGDFFMINMNSTVSDHIGLYRFMLSILRAYANISDPVSGQDFLAARRVGQEPDQHLLKDGIGRLTRVMEMLGSTLNPPARIAEDGGDQDQGGLGFMPVRFSSAQTRRLQTLRHGGATINDLLVTTLHMAIERWNTDHGQNTGRISMVMPMNTRGDGWRDEIASNLCMWVNVVSRASDREDFDSLLATITRQTSNLKESVTMAVLVDLMRELRALPAWIRQAVPALLPLTGNRIGSTTVLGNLGAIRMPLPMDGELALSELWFSPPCRMPMGLSLGALTLDDHLHLSFRYHRQQFHRESAWAFAEIFLDILNRHEST